MTAPLYAIAQEFREAIAALAELDIDDPQTIADTIEGMAAPLEDKLRAVIAYSLEVDILATGAADAAKRMKERADSLDARVKGLREYALRTMQATGVGEIATDEWAAKLAKKPPSVIIDEALLPPEFWRETVTRSPDKSGAMLRLKAGQEIPGARLSDTSYRLAIR